MTDAPSTPPLVVTPVRRLDSASSPAFEEEINARLAGGARDLVIDFSGVDYISSAGLRVILVAGKKLKAAGGRLALAGLRDNCREVFEISGFVALFPVFDTVEAARAAG
ncbi:STAS domain-containing protein [Ancylobacter terrae]|uniref:STAS domain-containing protein n=1 Tax=Ancylobacter sp. sgz301288 TaxID=3342077 RepID=UPI00385DB040